MPENKKKNKRGVRTGAPRRGKQPKQARAKRSAATRSRVARATLSREEREKQETMAKYLAMLSSPNAPAVGIPFGFPVAVTARRTQARRTITTSASAGYGQVWRRAFVNNGYPGLESYAMTSSMQPDTFASNVPFVPFLYAAGDFSTYPTLRARVCAIHIRVECVSNVMEIEGTYTTAISPEGSTIGDLTYSMAVARPWTKSHPARNVTEMVWIPKTLTDYEWLDSNDTPDATMPYVAALYIPATNYAQQYLITTTYYHEYSGGPVDGPRSVPFNSALARATAHVLPNTADTGSSVADSCYSYVAAHYPEVVGVFSSAAGLGATVLTAGKAARNRADLFRLDNIVGRL